MTRREEIVKDLKTAHAIFKTCGVPFVLYRGNLLGLVKYGDIMEWDNNVNLAVTPNGESDAFDSMRCLASYFHQKGFNVNARGNVMRFRRNVEVEVSFYHLDGVWYRRGKSRRFKLCYPRAFFEDPVKREFLGKTFLVPRPLDDYLEWEYGPRWKTDVTTDGAMWKKFVARRRQEGHW